MPTGVMSIHSPSEHTIDEAHLDAEVHIELESQSGKKAFVSFLFNRSSEGNSTSEFIESLQLQNAGSGLADDISPRVRNLVEQSGTNVVYYEGSLTKPPCTQRVSRVVYTNV